MTNKSERAAFEKWYIENAFDYCKDPIGSRDCSLQWSAWQARAQLIAEQEKAASARVLDGWTITAEANPMGGKQAMRLHSPNGRSSLFGTFSEEALVRDFLAMLAAPPKPETDRVAAQGGDESSRLWSVIDRMLVDAWVLGDCEKSMDMLAMRKRFDEALRATPSEGMSAA